MKKPIDSKADFHPHAYGGRNTKQDNIKSQRIEVISTADDKVNLSEPSSPYQAQYPYNKVEATESGHIREIDDTPGAERIFEMHKSGTFYEIHPDGTKVNKIFGDDWEISIQDKQIVVGGNLNIVVQGNATLLVAGNVKQKIGGNLETIVQGDMITRVKGNSLFYGKGDVDIQTNSNLRLRSKLAMILNGIQKMALETAGSFSNRVSGIAQYFSSGRTYVDASRLDWNLRASTPSPVNLNDKDPGAGLNVAQSVIEPSAYNQLITRTDNIDFSGILEDDVTYPKDRTLSD